MPIIKSAIKRAKQAIKRRDRNVGIKKDIKDATKSFIGKPTASSLSIAQSELDTAAKKGLLKKNTVARRKSKLHKIAKAAGVKLTSSQKSSPKEVAAKPKTAKKAISKKPVAKKSSK